MSTQFPSRSNTSTGGNPPIDLKNSLRLLAIAAALGGISAFLFNSFIYAATYQCLTEIIDNSARCHKYQISPSFKDLGIVSNSACPNNPPSNCP